MDLYHLISWHHRFLTRTLKRSWGASSGIGGKKRAGGPSLAGWCCAAAPVIPSASSLPGAAAPVACMAACLYLPLDGRLSPKLLPGHRIVEARELASIKTTQQLAQVVGSTQWSSGKGGKKGGKGIHPATRTFQVQ